MWHRVNLVYLIVCACILSLPSMLCSRGIGPEQVVVLAASVCLSILSRVDEAENRVLERGTATPSYTDRCLSLRFCVRSSRVH